MGGSFFGLPWLKQKIHPVLWVQWKERQSLKSDLFHVGVMMNSWPTGGHSSRRPSCDSEAPPCEICLVALWGMAATPQAVAIEQELAKGPLGYALIADHAAGPARRNFAPLAGRRGDRRAIAGSAGAIVAGEITEHVKRGILWDDSGGVRAEF